MNAYAPQPSEEQDPLVAVDTEAALLGAMLTDNDLIARFAGQLKADDFSEALHARIFSAMLKFHAKAKPANAVSLRPVFLNDESALGGDYLEKITDSPALVLGAETFVDQIVELSSRRKVRTAAQTTLDRLSKDFDAPVVEIAAGVQEAAWSTDTIAEKPRTLVQMIGLVKERHRRIHEDDGRAGCKNALVQDMDRVFGEIEQAMYLILAARPGMGKTILASSAAIGYAAMGNPICYAMAEMTPEQLALRQAADLSMALGKPIEHSVLKSGLLTPKQHQHLKAVEEYAATLPLEVIGIKGWTIRRLEAEVFRRQAMLRANGQDLKIMVVDYLQLLSAEIDGREVHDDRQRVNMISRGIRNICDRTGIAVIALSQLSRNIEQRQDKRPTLSDLRESGKLEEDADAVGFVYREEYYLEREKPKADERDAKGLSKLEAWETEMNFVRGKADLIGEKNRHGKRRTETMNFIGKYTAMRGGDVDVLEDGFAQPQLFGDDE